MAARPAGRAARRGKERDMADETTEPQGNESTEPTEPQGDGVDWQAKYEELKKESRKWEKRAETNKQAAEELEKAHEAGKTAEERIGHGYDCGESGADGCLGGDTTRAWQRWLNDQAA